MENHSKAIQSTIHLKNWKFPRICTLPRHKFGPELRKVDHNRSGDTSVAFRFIYGRITVKAYVCVRVIRSPVWVMGRGPHSGRFSINRHDSTIGPLKQVNTLFFSLLFPSFLLAHLCQSQSHRVVCVYLFLFRARFLVKKKLFYFERYEFSVIFFRSVNLLYIFFEWCWKLIWTKVCSKRILLFFEITSYFSRRSLIIKKVGRCCPLD